jgi:hypothetical protein
MTEFQLTQLEFNQKYNKLISQKDTLSPQLYEIVIKQHLQGETDEEIVTYLKMIKL